jgi:hypothetical protein
LQANGNDMAHPKMGYFKRTFVQLRAATKKIMAVLRQNCGTHLEKVIAVGGSYSD